MQQVPESTEKDEASRRAIVVLGMHRGGTSALTRVLSLCGATLPKRILPPMPDNKAGFWESSNIAGIQEELLASAGSSWHDTSEFPYFWFRSSSAESFKRRLVEALKEEFSDAPLIVVKDPRACRLVPLWISVLQDFGAQLLFVIPVRNPLEVVASLQVRDGFPETKSLLLWLWHFLLAERATRGFKRSFISYSDLLDDWPREIKKIGLDLDLNWPRAVDEARADVETFLSTKLRHHVVTKWDVAAPTDISEWVKTTFDWAIRATKDLPTAPTELNAVYAALQSANVVRLDEPGTRRASTASSLERRLCEQAQRIAALKDKVPQWDEQMTIIWDEVVQRNKQISTLKCEFAQRDQQIAALKDELACRDQEIALMLSSRSWHITAPLRLISALLHRCEALRIDVVQRPAYYARKIKGGYTLWRRDGYKAVIARLKSSPAALTTQGTYQDWINEFDRIDEIDRAAIRAHIESFQHPPKISILIPVYNTPEKWLRRAIGSVRTQLYTNWELCIADDASTEPHVRQVLKEYERQDVRIKVVYREQNGHISAASNSALELATGEYIALLDHDDELPEHALYVIAEEIKNNPDVQLIFSDEDKIDEHGQRFDPNFKPDWNPDLFLGQNYICHLGVYEAKQVRAIGGFREGYEGSQDYDLALRIVEGIEPCQIRHIPHILYHWRAIPGSTAEASEEKIYAAPAARRAVSDHLQRQDILAEVLPAPVAPMFQRVRYPLCEQPLVSIIIPTRDGYEILRRCIKSLQEKTDYKPYEILIIDNQSTDPQTLTYLQELERSETARVLRYDQPFNYSAINNFAAENAEGDVLCLLNNDTEVISAEWLREMISHALRPEVGAVGTKLLYPGGRIQHAGVILGIGGVAGHALKNVDGCAPGYFGRAVLTQEFSAVTGACLVLRRELYRTIGGLDEDLLAVAFNDIDLCIRLKKAGYRNVVTPYALLYHHESVSRGYEDNQEKLARFQSEVKTMQERWGSVLLNDPHYNPNLSLSHEDFSIAWPPRIQKPWKRSKQSRVENGWKHRIKGYELLNGQGIEIGALHQPAPVPNGCVVEYCDAISKEVATKLFPELEANDLVEPNYICNIDKEQLPFADGSLDFVIMNHVIGHTANPIRIIKEIFRVTASDGAVVLSAPDKDYTFDKKRQLTSFDHILDDYQRNVTEVSDEHYLDFITAVHPEVLDRRPVEVSNALASVRKRREHAHIWDSTTFKDHLTFSMKILGIDASNIYESQGYENRLEYFSVWRKHAA